MAVDVGVAEAVCVALGVFSIASGEVAVAVEADGSAKVAAPYSDQGLVSLFALTARTAK